MIESQAQIADKWLATARCGQKLLYHYGDLAKDRLERADLDALATRLSFAEQRGFVTLTQLRAGFLSNWAEPKTMYIATHTGLRDA